MSRSDSVRRSINAAQGSGQDALSRTLEALRAGSREAAGSRRAAAASPTSVRPEAAPPWRDAPSVPDDVRGLVLERQPRRALDELVFSPEIVEDVRDLLHEFGHASLLRSHSLEPRHKLLLVGPPGNGKTSLAEAIAFEAGLPFLTVRYDALVDSFLGETAARLRRLMDYASAYPCLLFFDEFDSVGKERGDTQDVGEMKRVVGSLLVQLDAIPSHTMVVCATNHPELLDRAVWRRFEVKISVGPPAVAELRSWFRRLSSSIGMKVLDEERFVSAMSGRSFSDIEAFTLDVRRKLVLSKGTLTPDSAFGAGLDAWSRRILTERAIGSIDGAKADCMPASGTGRRQKATRKKSPTSAPGELI